MKISLPPSLSPSLPLSFSLSLSLSFSLSLSLTLLKKGLLSFYPIADYNSRRVAVVVVVGVVADANFKNGISWERFELEPWFFAWQYTEIIYIYIYKIGSCKPVQLAYHPSPEKWDNLENCCAIGLKRSVWVRFTTHRPRIELRNLVMLRPIFCSPARPTQKWWSLIMTFGDNDSIDFIPTNPTNQITIL